MRKVREVLRLKFELGRSQRQIAQSCGLGLGTVSDYLQRARASAVSWEDAKTLTDNELEARLFKQTQYRASLPRAPIDLGWVHEELRRTGVTLQLLWTEYVEAAQTRDGEQPPYQYTQFCEHYHRWRGRLDVVMRQTYRAGEKAFLDYSGKRPSIIDASTGEVIDVELFVMVLGASNYTFAEATRTQQLPDFIGSVTRGLDFFGGVPEVLVPDQLRSAVSGPDRYDPDINGTLLELATHYGTAIIPARPRKPRDKAKVEVGVQIAQRWIVARLRHRRFFNLAELNLAVAELLEELNSRAFKKLPGSRRSAFAGIDQSALKPLPKARFVITERKSVRVTSTTTSSSTSASTALRTRSSASASRAARQNRWSRSGMAASASTVTSDLTDEKDRRRRATRIGPLLIAITGSGRPSDSSVGLARSVPMSRASLR